MRPSSNTDTGGIKIGNKKRGDPSIILPNELDKKLRSFLVHLRTVGGTINRNIVYGVLMGLIKANLQKWGAYWISTLLTVG